MATFVSPIGFNTTSVTRSLLTHGVGSGDEVVLLRPEDEADDDRATEAVEDVERYVHEIEPEVSVSVERVPHDDFPGAVMACSDLLSTADEPVVNMGGGARDVLVPLTVATVAHAQEINTTLGYSDLDGQVREWLMPRVGTNPSDGAIETLALIDASGAETSIADLVSQCDRAKSTVTRHVNQLEDEGLVTSRTEDRSKRIKITLDGRLCLAIRPDS
jgi:CRISPR-associated protein Csa3